MRSSTFRNFTIRLTEKQYKQLKKRFNPDNFRKACYSPDSRNETPCLCRDMELRNRALFHEDSNTLEDFKVCRGCPFALPNGIGTCGMLFMNWCDGHNLVSFRLLLNPAVVVAENGHGLDIAKAIYQELLSWKKESHAAS